MHIVAIGLALVMGAAEAPPQPDLPAKVEIVDVGSLSRATNNARLGLSLRRDTAGSEWMDRLTDFVPFAPGVDRLWREHRGERRWYSGASLQFQIRGGQKRFVLNLGPIKIVPYTMHQQP